MLTFKRQLIEIGEENKNLFINLHLDTHKTGYLSSWDRFFKGDVTNSKPWIGEVETNEKKFKIAQTKAGILGSPISSIVIVGQEINDGIIKKLKLAYGFSWFTTFNALIFTFLLSITVFLFLQDIWGWLIFFSVGTILTLLVILNLNKAEEGFHEYLDSRRSKNKQE
jgi:hypothetical protein